MANTKKETEEKQFNDTLKRMLKTPPKPHEKAAKAKAAPKKPTKKEQLSR